MQTTTGAIELKPDDAQAWSDRGVIYYLAGDNEKAVRNCAAALRTIRAPTPTAPPPARRSATSTSRSKVMEYYNSRGLGTQGVRRGRSPMRSGWSSGRTSSPDAAIPISTRASSAPRSTNTTPRWLDPNFAQAYNNRAVLYKTMGDRAKALADYEAALRLDPGNESAANGRRTVKAEIARSLPHPQPRLEPLQSAAHQSKGELFRLNRSDLG